MVVSVAVAIAVYREGSAEFFESRGTYLLISTV